MTVIINAAAIMPLLCKYSPIQEQYNVETNVTAATSLFPGLEGILQALSHNTLYKVPERNTDVEELD